MMNNTLKNILFACKKIPIGIINNIHTSSVALAWKRDDLPKSFIKANKIIFPPQDANEERRPAFVCHQKTNLKYSPDKMWYVASFIRGMTIDEAIKQLNFVNKKGAKFVQEAILEAQDLAVKKHNVEFKSNLWIAESFCGLGPVLKGVRRHARGRMGEVRYKYCHYFVKLEEGTPPKNYYKHNPMTPEEQLDTWLDGMRRRKIINSY